MSGEQFYDIIAMSTLGTKGPTNVVRFGADAAGNLWVSVKGAPFVPFAQAINASLLGFDFASETLVLAKTRISSLGVNRAIGTDFVPIWEAALSPANTPVIDIAREGTGGVLSFSGAGASSVALNPVTPGAATYNPILGAFACRAAPWMVRSRILINAAAFTAGTTVVLCSLDGSGVGGTGATNKIQIVSNPALNPQQTYVRLQNAAGGPVDYSTGPDGLLNGSNSLLPSNQFVPVTLYFDGVRIRWMFGDQFNPLNVLDATVLSVPASGGAAIGQLDDMPGSGITDYAASVTVSSTDTTIGANFKIDGLAIAYGVNQENV